MKEFLRLIKAIGIVISFAGCFEHPLSTTHDPLDPNLVGTWVNSNNERYDVVAKSDHYEIFELKADGAKSHALNGYLTKVYGENILQIQCLIKSEFCLQEWAIVKYSFNNDFLTFQGTNPDYFKDRESGNNLKFRNQQEFRDYFLSKYDHQDFFKTTGKLKRIRMEAKSDDPSNSLMDLTPEVQQPSVTGPPVAEDPYKKLRESLAQSTSSASQEGPSSDPSAPEPSKLATTDPMEKFRGSLSATQETVSPPPIPSTPPVPVNGGPVEDPFAKFRKAAPKNPENSSANNSPLPTNSTEVILYCEGNLNQKLGQKYVQDYSETFSFRTSINLAEKTHTVANVLKGSLFKNGGSYSVIDAQSDVWVLQAESTNSRWEILKVRYDKLANRLSGEGKVDMTESRERVRSAIRGLFKRMGAQVPNSPSEHKSSVDGLWSVEIDGACQLVE